MQFHMLKIQCWAGIHETKLNNHGEQNVCLEFHRLLGVDFVGTAVYGVESLKKEREDGFIVKFPQESETVLGP